MGKKKAWWKKISIKSITGTLGTAFNFLSGGSKAAENAPAQPIVIQNQGISPNMLLIGAAVALLLILLMMRKG